MPRSPIRILMVEDNDGDVFLTKKALQSARVANEVEAVCDGVEALQYLRHQPPYAHAHRPDLILLDLNLPRLDGRGVLAAVKGDPDLSRIPVIVLSGSKSEQDILRAYALRANCYIVKPVGLDALMDVAKAIEDFWFTVVTLPPRAGRSAAQESPG